MASHIGRRKFLATLGGAAATWPLAARAQQPERMRRIGVLMSVAADDPEAPARVGAFSQGLAELGWTIGRNVRIDYRWFAGDADTARKYAVELVALAPDVVLASGTQGMTAIQQVNRPVPVVFALVADPVGAGFVDSLARPGGNATGFMLCEYSISGKWLELLKQIAPHVAQVAVLRDQTIATGIAQFSTIQALAPFTRSAGEPRQCAERQRGREQDRDLRAHSKRRSDRNRVTVGDSSSSDHKARRPIQAARHLRKSHRRR
jgi:putative tryptophan/tyrosine transport system substrate-binding protein